MNPNFTISRVKGGGRKLPSFSWSLGKYLSFLSFLILADFRDLTKGDGAGGGRSWGLQPWTWTSVKQAITMLPSWIPQHWMRFGFILRQNFIVYNASICKTCAGLRLLLVKQTTNNSIPSPKFHLIVFTSFIPVFCIHSSYRDIGSKLWPSF